MTAIGRKLVRPKKLMFKSILTCFNLGSSSAEKVKSLSKKDTAPRGKKDEIKDFDQWWRKYNWTEEYTEEDVFLRIGFICICIFKPVHSISRLKITDTVVLLWWIMKLQIFWNQVFRVGFWKATHLYLVNLHNAYVLRKAIWWTISADLEWSIYRMWRLFIYRSTCC